MLNFLSLQIKEEPPSILILKLEVFHLFLDNIFYMFTLRSTEMGHLVKDDAKKRADARKTAAEKALDLLSTEEIEVLAIAEKAEEEAGRIVSTDDREMKVNGHTELNDEICSD